MTRKISPWERGNMPRSVKDVWDHDPEGHSWLESLRVDHKEKTEKADLFDDNLPLINQFAIVDGRHYWKGEDLDAMKEKAEKWDEWWAKEGEHLIEGQLMAKKLETVKTWFKALKGALTVYANEWEELEEILGVKDEQEA